MSIKLKEEEFIDVSDSLNEIQDILKRNKVDYSVFRNNQSILNELIETYCKENSINDKKQVNEIKKQMLNIIK